MICQPPGRLKVTCRSRSNPTLAKKMSASVLVSMVCLSSHTSQQDIDDDVGHAGKRRLSVLFRKHPGRDHFIDRAEEAVYRDFYRELRPKDPCLLAFTQHTP